MQKLGGGGYLSSLDLPRGSGAVGGHDTTQEIPLGCCGEEGHREDLSAPFDCEHAASCRIRCAWILLFDHWVPPCYLLVEGVSWIVMVVVVRADQVSKAWDCRKIIFCESERKRGKEVEMADVEDTSTLVVFPCLVRQSPVIAILSQCKGLGMFYTLPRSRFRE